MSLIAISTVLVGVNIWAATNFQIEFLLCAVLCALESSVRMYLYVCVRLCAPNLLQWAVMNSHVRSGTPWLWCECNEGFRCRSSPASHPSPSPRNYSKHTQTHTHTHSYTLINGFKLNHLHNGLKADFACVLCIWPDAVLVGHSDAGVEGVELHNRRYSRVAVDEYLIIQTGNTCNGVDKPEWEQVSWNWTITGLIPAAGGAPHPAIRNLWIFRFLQQEVPAEINLPFCGL